MTQSPKAMERRLLSLPTSLAAVELKAVIGLIAVSVVQSVRNASYFRKRVEPYFSEEYSQLNIGQTDRCLATQPFIDNQHRRQSLWLGCLSSTVCSNGHCT